MKTNTYEIKYNKGGEVTSEFLYSKMELVMRYINILTDNNFKCSSLKVFENGVDITTRINNFLTK